MLPYIHEEYGAYKKASSGVAVKVGGGSELTDRVCCNDNNNRGLEAICWEMVSFSFFFFSHTRHICHSKERRNVAAMLRRQMPLL